MVYSAGVVGDRALVLQFMMNAAHAVLVAGGRNVDNSSVVSSSGHEKPSDFLQRVMWAEVRHIPLEV